MRQSLQSVFTSQTMAALSTFFLVSLLFMDSVTVVDGDDSAAMLKLAAALRPTPSTWSADSSYCEWDGVRCNAFNSVVVIDLAFQSISGSLPSELSSLHGLSTLNLTGNSLSGSIPSLANLTFLTELILENNSFTSISPGFFRGLSGVKVLSLSNNVLLPPWTIPTELKECISLTVLSASNANVIGSLPDIFGYFPSLQNITLSYNNLTGSLPTSFRGSAIESLQLNNQVTGLSGTIDILSEMAQLAQLWLHGNRFSGPIPDLWKCKELSDLRLDDNQLTGIVPQSLYSLLNLEDIYLENNKLQGPFPAFLLQTLSKKVRLDGNNFCTNNGSLCDFEVTTLLEIASAFGYPLILSDSWRGNDACNGWLGITCDFQTKNITGVDFSNQHFTGTISPSFANLTSLQKLILNTNSLTSSIPDSLTKLSRLQVLDVSNNNLSGSIPSFAPRVKISTAGNRFMETGTASGNGGAQTGTASGNGKAKLSRDWKTYLKVIIIVVTIVGIIDVSTCMFLLRMLKKWNQARKRKSKNNQEEVQGLPIIDFHEIVAATGNFDQANKLGQGGFGSVYWGRLQDGQEIAVKKLSRASTQGVEEFRNEVFVISKLQHRNLVRLLGCCIEGEAKMLIYEYMPKKSLDAYIFDVSKKELLDWRKRLNIIEGIGRGLLYLHRDSRLRIIHRDLKASNILLDEDLNPKISDFGMAKIFVGNEDHDNTRRIAGTFGYMSPEYAMEGRFSEKSDVFSFGVLVLEIISGRKNTSFYNDENSLTLVGHVWKLWNEGNVLVFRDPVISNPRFQGDILRCIQVGLLCVQEFAKDRPTMSTVISMLDNDISDLPTPKQPAFTEIEGNHSQPNPTKSSLNDVTLTSLGGR